MRVRYSHNGAEVEVEGANGDEVQEGIEILQSMAAMGVAEQAESGLTLGFMIAEDRVSLVSTLSANDIAALSIVESSGKTIAVLGVDQFNKAASLDIEDFEFAAL